MGQSEGSFRDKVGQVTGKSWFILTAVIVGLLLSIFAGQIGTLLFYVVVLITLWARRWDWPYFSLTRPDWPKTVYKAVLFTFGIFILSDFIIQPVIELAFGQVDLSEVATLEGNLPSYLLFIVLGWVMGGFCEEIIYRGYVLKRLAVIFGNTNTAWFLSAIIASAVFGVAHSYQGLSGVITTGIIALLFGVIFIFNKNNLFVLVLTHGLYNMIAITLIYLGKARMITDWVHGLIK